jgi:hypothetical protein
MLNENSRGQFFSGEAGEAGHISHSREYVLHFSNERRRVTEDGAQQAQAPQAQECRH